MADEPLGVLVVGDGGAAYRVPIFDQLFIGRECAGITPARRLVMSGDPEMSHTHLEIRLDAAHDQAFVVDTSTNGTWVNDVRLERAVPLPIRSGDRIRIGATTMTFLSRRFAVAAAPVAGRTRARIDQVAMVMVVGDIVDYSTISQVTDEGVLARSLNTLWQQVSDVLRLHRGTLSHYAGDAMFAVWELRRLPDAAALAVDFALAAHRLVAERGAELPLRGPDGAPIRMGWGVVQGMVALAAMTRSADAVIGDSANVAFRLSGLAGRNGRAAVLGTRGIQRSLSTRFVWGAGEHVEIKGRYGTEEVFPALGRR